MAAKKMVIWSNINLDFKNWESDLRSNYPDKTDDELYELMHQINDSYLDDARMNLNIQLNRPIIVIADLGLWYGRRSGYKIIESGNIRDCLYDSSDYAEWYVDGKNNLRAVAHHHDGTNYYLYRVFKDDASEDAIETLKNKIYEGKFTSADISRVTKRLGDYIARIYGW